MKKVAKILSLTLLLLVFNNKTIMAQLDATGSVSTLGSSITLTSPSDLWHSTSPLGGTYHMDALKLGSDAWGQITIGGAAPGLPIMWGKVYPSTYNNGSTIWYPAKFYASSSYPSIQLIYEPWGQRMSFQSTTNHSGASAGTTATWQDVLTFDASGHVGIGTYPQCFNLAVEGTDGIACRAIKVLSSGWCDYVFKNDYKLMPINDLATYVAKNHHLPEVPTDNDIKENGLDLAPTQVILLKKIEEMSLYIIDMNKKIESLQKEVEVLKTCQNNQTNK